LTALAVTTTGASGVGHLGPASLLASSPQEPSASTSSAGSAATASVAPYTVQTEQTSLGTILADGQDLTLYTFTTNGSPTPCDEACARVWPPVVVPAGTQPIAGPGVTGLGTTTNAYGDQVTYNGLPLYLYVGDNGPGVVNGNGIVSFGGTWLVVKVAAAAACTPGSVTPSPVGIISRLAGATRDATSVAVSQATYQAAGSAGAVVLASDAGYPDALAGTPLAVSKHGPLLLTTPAGLDLAVGTEIGRVLPKGGTVYLLGGDAALASVVDSQIQALGDVPQRVAGADRFATAVAIAGVLGDPHTVLEATGLDFPDGLSAGAAAAKAGGAVLLSDGSTQAPETATYLAAHPGDTVTAVGGPAALADPSATALVGADRFATAVMVAVQFFAEPTTVGLASGLGFPDALAGGAGIGAGGGPLLLVPACGALPSSLASYLSSVHGSVTGGTLYGGTGVVGDDVLAELDQAA